MGESAAPGTTPTLYRPLGQRTSRDGQPGAERRPAGGGFSPAPPRRAIDQHQQENFGALPHPPEVPACVVIEHSVRATRVRNGCAVHLRRALIQVVPVAPPRPLRAGAQPYPATSAGHLTDTSAALPAGHWQRPDA